MEFNTEKAEEEYKNGMETRKSHPLKALEHFEAAVKYDPKHKKAYLEGGIIAMFMDNVEKSRSYFEKSLELHEENNEWKIESAELNNLLGVLEWRQQHQAAAKEYFIRSKEIYEHFNKQVSLVFTNILINLSSIYFEIGDFEHSISYFKEAKGIYEQMKLTNTTGYAMVITGIAKVQFERGDNENALKNYILAKNTYETIPKTESTQYAFLLSMIARVYKKNNDPKEALNLMEKSKDTFESLGHLNNVKLMEKEIEEIKKNI